MKELFDDQEVFDFLNENGSKIMEMVAGDSGNNDKLAKIKNAIDVFCVSINTVIIIPEESLIDIINILFIH